MIHDKIKVSSEYLECKYTIILVFKFLTREVGNETIDAFEGKITL